MRFLQTVLFLSSCLMVPQLWPGFFSSASTVLCSVVFRVPSSSLPFRAHQIAREVVVMVQFSLENTLLPWARCCGWGTFVCVCGWGYSTSPTREVVVVVVVWFSLQNNLLTRERERRRELEVYKKRERGRETEREREGELKNSDWNSKTLFYKDCRSGSIRNLSTSPCKATDEYK